MKIMRTPETRFHNLSGYSFKPHYLRQDDGEGRVARIHYIDEGPREGFPVLLLHGQPTYSFLYRKMVPFFVEEGFRVLAPDLLGFGRSDKPNDVAYYSIERHIRSMTSFVETLGLRGVTLFCHDWGGFIGLCMAARLPDRFDRIVVCNTGLWSGEEKLNEAAKKWFAFTEQHFPDLPIGEVIPMGMDTPSEADVIAGYEAPFPDVSFKAGVAAFPRLFPRSGEDEGAHLSRAAWRVLSRWRKPFLTLFGKNDLLCGGYAEVFKAKVPGAEGQPHAKIDGGHFIQEENSEELARRTIEFIKATEKHY